MENSFYLALMVMVAGPSCTAGKPVRREVSKMRSAKGQHQLLGKMQIVGSSQSYSYMLAGMLC
jgi:hypothetical protein